MEESTLVHQSFFSSDGIQYPIHVYCRCDKRYFAHTDLGGKDIVINDGTSLEEVLAKHLRLLPLALNSRKMNADCRGFPRRVE